ncbi:hypothetical protein Egran_00685 [Elaphomyces granulatus]|uniref:DNA mismatch repair proteins mutS family domain-containing protein n=1 Tax=Elaphomyces granulatus TaxID=519963 RepID=A0A232M5J6_9EURO|nr:hypothetical protein Egran_00685 [Elaphomyces granulatus]
MSTRSMLPSGTSYSHSYDDLASRSRSLARTLTGSRTARPTTATTSIMSQEIICAISESRGVSTTVGLAFINLSMSEAVLCQICDNQTYVRTVNKIGVFDPIEILLMSTAKDPQSKLYSAIQESLPELTITFIDRKYWSDKSGHDYVEMLAFPETIESLKLFLDGNYFAACCFAAVLKYVEVEFDRSFVVHSLRIRFEPSEGSMMIDLSTVNSLELIQNIQNAKSKDCLFGLLNETLTPMGSRLLRSNILQPLTEENKIRERYDALEELSTKEEMFYLVRQALKGFLDSDKVLTALVLTPARPSFYHPEQCVNNVIMLKSYVSSIKPVHEALTGAQSNLLLAIRTACAPAVYLPIQGLIDATLNEDVTYQSRPLDLRNQRIYAVKAGVNTLLDVARQTYKETNVDASDLVSKLAEDYHIHLDLKFDPARQFYICLSAAELDNEQLPDIFINCYRKKDRIECQTLDLVKLNQRINNAHDEVICMSDHSVQELINDVCTEISGLFRISEAIATLDMLAAFSQLVTTRDYVRPELTDALGIKAGRHPIREKIHATKFVPNDTYATRQTRFQIITGCNMSGKSTYIRSIALMTIMAQIGCFVPAQYASFPVVHKLFARAAAVDEIESNISTFATEMREMSFILQNVEPRSMVIVDELGRGTSTTDGLAIAIAIAEALVESQALVWFATHFRDLARIMAERCGVVNLHLAVQFSAEADRMTMLYRVEGGHVQEQFYGLVLAKLVPLPPGVLEGAEKVSKGLKAIAERQHGNHEVLSTARKRNLVLHLKEQLQQALKGSMEGEALRKWLRRLQNEFSLKMAAIDHAGTVSENSEPDGEDESGGRQSEEEGFESDSIISYEDSQDKSTAVDTPVGAESIWLPHSDAIATDFGSSSVSYPSSLCDVMEIQY